MRRRGCGGSARVVLKLLGFKGECIDYSTERHPVRNLDEPIGYRLPGPS